MKKPSRVNARRSRTKGRKAGPARRKVSLPKITRPALSDVYQRKRLFRSLDGARKHPLIWIAAPAGAGKTTLVASYLQIRRLPVLWYQVDAGDADIASFFHYLGLAVQQAAPRQRPLPKLTPEYFGGIETFARNFFREIALRLRGRYVLVFDNLQDAGEHSPLDAILSAGLSELPAQIRSFLISRNEPSEAFVRLQLSGTLTRLGWKELQLQEDESSALVRFLKAGPESAVKEQSAHLHRQCEGWMAGLILLLEGARAGDGSVSAGVNTQTLFDYFIAEVFSRRAPEVQDFLTRTALFSHFTAEMGTELTANPRARALLNDLVRQHYFTERRAEPAASYQYHPLFREFLLERARSTFSPDELVALRRRAAGILERSVQPEQALSLYLEANDPGMATALILAQAPNWASAGRFATLAAAIERLPSAIVEQEPWLQYWQGNCCLGFDPMKARGYYERSYERFRATNRPDGCYLNWAGIVESFVFLWDDFTGLKQWLEKFESLQQDFPPSPDRVVEERVSYAAFTAHIWVAPEWNKIGKWLAPAERVAQDSADLSLRILTAASLCHYYAWTGERDRHARVVEMVRSLVRSESASILARLWALSMESMYHWLQGASDKSRRISLEAKALADESGVHIMDSFISASLVYAANNGGDMATAQISLEEFRQFLLPQRRLDSAHWEYHAGQLAAMQGNYVRAEQLLTHAIEMTRALGISVPEAICRLSLARALAPSGRVAEARALLDPVLLLAQAMRSHLFQSEYHLVRAWIAWHTAEESECILHLREAFTISATHGFTSHWTWDPKLTAVLCQVALKHGIATTYVRDLIHGRRLEPASSSDELEGWPWPVKIYTLGCFQVLLDEKPVKFASKAQKKPLELLKALIAFGAREVPLAKLTDALWPEAEADAAYASITMAIKRLRALLHEPNAIRLTEGRLTLDPRYCWVDLWAFERQADDGRHALEADLRGPTQQAERALTLYTGSFLGQDDHAAWALSTRERLQQKFLRLSGLVAQSWQAAADWPKAIACYRRGLEVDPLVEDFYRHLMRCQAQSGEPSAALQTYEHCRKVLASQLGVAPSPKTEALCREIREHSR